MCVGGGGSSTRNTLVSASSEDSRESVRSLESALFCADFYNSSKSNTYCTVKIKYGILIKWAAAWDFQKFDILTSVDSHEPVQPPFKLRNLKWGSVSSLTVRIFKRPEKALISLCVCAGLSEPLVVAHTKLLEISCHDSNVYENINLSFFENKKSSDSVLEFLIARLQWNRILVRAFSGPKIVKWIHIAVYLKCLDEIRYL